VNVLREVKPERPEFSVLAGFEDLILPSVLAGGDGSICGLANVAPELFVGLVRCAQNGELDEAAERHRRVLSLLALGGLVVLHQALRPRAPTLSTFAAGLTVATAAVWALLQAVDGITLKQAVDAWVAADGSDKAVRFADAEIVRWTEWGAQSYFRVLMGATLLVFGVAILVARLLAGWTGWVAILAGILSLSVGVDVGYSGLDSGFQQIASPAFQVLMLVFGAGVVVAAAHSGAGGSAHD